MTAGRRPPGQRPRQERSTQPHRGRPTLSSACSFVTPPWVIVVLRIDGTGDPLRRQPRPSRRVRDVLDRRGLEEMEAGLVVGEAGRAEITDATAVVGRTGRALRVRCGFFDP